MFSVDPAISQMSAWCHSHLNESWKAVEYEWTGEWELTHEVKNASSNSGFMCSEWHMHRLYYIIANNSERNEVKRFC